MSDVDRPSEQDMPALDLSALATNTMKDTDLQIEVLQLFFGQSASLIQSLHNSTDDNSWYAAAHALKGGARSVGLMPLGALAEEAEGMMGAINDVTRKAHCQRISNEIDRARAAVFAHFPEIF